LGDTLAQIVGLQEAPIFHSLQIIILSTGTCRGV
jgi:hypothetical protein